MPTVLMNCRTCHGRRPIFVEDELTSRVFAGETLSLRCPVCREETAWEYVSPERRTGGDRRASSDRPPRPDRRAKTDSAFVHLAQDGKMSSAADQRNFPRFFDVPKAYVLMVEGSGGLRDLSIGGAFISDEDPLKVGTEINLELRLGDYSIPVKGIVRRSIHGQGMGIQFLEIPPEGKRRLKVYLAGLAAPEHLKKEGH